MDREKTVLAGLAEDFYRPTSARELAAKLKLGEDAVQAVLKSLVEKGILMESNGDYSFHPQADTVAGYYQAHLKGYGFVHVGGDIQYYVSPGTNKGAVDGDIVLCQVLSREPGKAPSVRITDFLQRRQRLVAARYSSSSGLGSVQDGNRKLMISPRNACGARDGDCVLASVSGYDAKVVCILDQDNLGRIDLLNIAAKKGIVPLFPPPVEKEAATIREDMEAALGNRLDLREENIVTIDGEETEDMDDAFSLTRKDDGNWHLGIHIADVAHYIAPGSELDREAARRALSVYLVDREIPMLPARLSRELCSLLPEADRLAVSCLVALSPQGEVLDYQFAETVVRSRQRLTYAQVDQGGCVQCSQMLDDALELIKILKEKRQERGAVYIALPTTSLCLNQEGQPVEMGPRQTGGARELVEELMILVNQLAADYLAGNNIAFLYRGNEGFYPGRGDDVKNFVSRWGYELEYPPSPKALQDLLSKIDGRPEEFPISRKLARCLHKSRYSVTPLGHYNLAVQRYTHFSSPIRRYSDLFIHRLIKQVINKQTATELERDLPRISEQCSFQERLAQDVEGECVELKKLQYLEAANTELCGLVVDRTGNGPLVWLENTAEGVVVAGNKEELAELVPGDRVQVKIHKLDYKTKQIYLAGCSENCTETIDRAVE